MLTDLLATVAPILSELPAELRGQVALLVLGGATFSAILTGAVCVVRFVAHQPRESADTLRLRAESFRADAEAQRYRAEAAKIEAESSHEGTERLREQIDRLERENDRLIAEGDKLLERLAVCQRTSRALEVQFSSLEERCRLLAEWVESRGGDVSMIFRGRVS